MIRDRFIAGHPNCALQRHLNSVPPETPIRDIVDRNCETSAGEGRPVYAVSKRVLTPADEVIAAVTGPSVRLTDLEVLLRCLLPTTPAPRLASTGIEALLKCLLSTTPAHAQAPPPRPATMDI